MHEQSSKRSTSNVDTERKTKNYYFIINAPVTVIKRNVRIKKMEANGHTIEFLATFRIIENLNEKEKERKRATSHGRSVKERQRPASGTPRIGRVRI